MKKIARNLEFITFCHYKLHSNHYKITKLQKRENVMNRRFRQKNRQPLNETTIPSIIYRQFRFFFFFNQKHNFAG